MQFRAGEIRRARHATSRRREGATPLPPSRPHRADGPPTRPPRTPMAIGGGFPVDTGKIRTRSDRADASILRIAGVARHPARGTSAGWVERSPVADIYPFATSGRLAVKTAGIQRSGEAPRRTHATSCPRHRSFASAAGRSFRRGSNRLHGRCAHGAAPAVKTAKEQRDRRFRMPGAGSLDTRRHAGIARFDASSAGCGRGPRSAKRSSKIQGNTGATGPAPGSHCVTAIPSRPARRASTRRFGRRPTGFVEAVRRVPVSLIIQREYSETPLDRTVRPARRTGPAAARCRNRPHRNRAGWQSPRNLLRALAL